MTNKAKVFSIPTFALIAVLLASPVFATIIRVPQDQPTIQAGIDATVNGDTVLVAPGTYTEHIDFLGKGILVTSSFGPDSTTITKSTNGLPLVKFQNNEGRTSILSGFTITDAASISGAINCFFHSSPTIVGNIIKNNLGGTQGIYASPLTGPLIERNLIIGNSIGIVCYDYDTAVIANNTIAGNLGNGIYLSYTSNSLAIKNNVIARNGRFGIEGVNSTPIIVYNDVYGNDSGSYRAVSPGVENISLDPKFKEGNPYNYQLKFGSPCIDSGDPNTPVPPRGGTRVDMGAFEFTNRPQFSLLFPMNNEMLIEGQPQLIWETIHDTLGALSANYKVFLSPNSNFLSADTSSVLTDTTWQAPYYLDFRQTYFWKVLAITDSADTIFSEEVLTFNIIDSPPGSFSLVSPTNISNIVTKTPFFDWGDAIDSDPVDPVKYTLIISTDSGFQFAYSQSNLSSSSFIVPSGVLNRGLRYFWKAKASDTQDSSKFSNEIFRFRLLYLGDLNADGILSPADIVFVLNHVFLGAPVDPPEVADMNCDGNRTPADVVLGLNTVFLGQSPPCDP